MQRVEQLPTNKYLNGTVIIAENRNNSKIITFSHFLTSKKLMKAYIDEMSLRRQQWLDSRKGTPPIEEWNNDSEFFINGWN
ncbi:unnamed protein product [Rotaria socialis]